VLVGALPYFKIDKKAQLALIFAIACLGMALLYIEVILYYRHDIIDALFEYSWLIPRGW
jgi:hypothetical protein